MVRTNPETYLSRAVESWLNWQPDIRVWRQNAGGVRIPRKDRPGDQFFRGAVKGAGDLSGVIKPGFRLEIEIKTAKGRQNKNQRQFEATLLEFGAYYILVRSLPDIEREIERIRRDIQTRGFQP